MAEQHKLRAEAYKLDSDACSAPIILLASAMTTGAAFFELFGH